MGAHKMTPSSFLRYSLVILSLSSTVLSDGETEGGSDLTAKRNGLGLEREIDQTPSQAAHSHSHPSNTSAFNVFPSPARVPIILSKAPSTCSRTCDLLRQPRIGSWCAKWSSRPGTEPAAAYRSWHRQPRAPLMRVGSVGCGGSSTFGGIYGSVSQCPALPSPATVLRVRGGGWLAWAPAAPAPKPNLPAASDRARPRDADDGARSRSGPSWWQRNKPFHVVRFREGFAVIWNRAPAHGAPRASPAPAPAPDGGGGGGGSSPPAGAAAAAAAGVRWLRAGPLRWAVRLLKLGVGLVTMQPMILALLFNIFKMVVIVRRLMRGIVDLDMDEKPGMGESVKSNTTFADVVGVDEAKRELEDIVAYLRDPGRFTRLGGKMTKGVLLWGPPGTGKTLLARAVAGEAGVPFKYASGSEFEEMYVGVGARRVRDLFSAAKKVAPCIVFIDEIDAIGSTRSLTDQQSLRQTLNQVLTELDGFAATEGLVVIGATNFPEVLDKALVRPGRFDRQIEVPLPDVKGREQIFTLVTRNVTLAADINVNVMARGTPGFSGADIANLVNKAACKASKDGSSHVTMTDLEFAKDLILMGAERSAAAFSLDNRRLTAYHEGGHALVACHTDGALPVHKATIVPRGQALGMVMQLPESDMTSWSRRQMMAEMDVCMAGRVAEELIFGPDNVTSGASSDLERATRIATNMVESLGMSDRIGYVAHTRPAPKRGGSGGGAAASEETRAVIDAEVRRLCEESYGRARRMLKARTQELHALAAALLERETLTGEEVRATLAAAAGGGGRGLLRRAARFLWGGPGRAAEGAGAEGERSRLEARLKSLESQVSELGEVKTHVQGLSKQLSEALAILRDRLKHLAPAA